MDRRRFLSLAGAAFVTGCGETSEDIEATENPPSTRTPTVSTATPEPTTTPTDTETRTATPTPIHAGYETTEVVVRSPAGERLGSVTAAIADTQRLRYRGLSDTPSLPEDRGMLFVFPAAGDHTFVMRGMDFGIDIVYAAPDGSITRVHHAEAPGPGEDGNSQRYPGTGQYVLEVVLGWTTERGVGTGDLLDFEL